MVDQTMLIAAGVVGALVAAAAISWWLSRSYSDSLYQKTITKGLNGFAGDTLTLSCPLDQVISFPNTNLSTTQGALVCQGNPSCDAFYSAQGQGKNFYSTNIVDVIGNIKSFPQLAACVGQSSCTFTVPTASQIPPGLGAACVRACTNLAYQGTYNCGPAP